MLPFKKITVNSILSTYSLNLIFIYILCKLFILYAYENYRTISKYTRLFSSRNDDKSNINREITANIISIRFSIRRVKLNTSNGSA